MSIYADQIKDGHWDSFNNWHFYNQAIVPESLNLEDIPERELEIDSDNVVWAILKNMNNLKQNSNSVEIDVNFGKAFSLVMLMHMVGDIH